MNLEQIDTSTTAGNGTEWLSDDAAQLALFKAIRDIKFGLPTDDKLILEGLRNAGLWIARYQPERSPPIGPGEVWVAVGPGPKLEGARWNPSDAQRLLPGVEGQVVKYIRADLAGEKG